MKSALAVIGFGVAMSLYWMVASAILAAPEPWDSPYYAAPLGAAVLLGGVASYTVPSNAGWFGFIAMFAQLPVLLIRSGVGPLLAVGLVVLAIESIPAIAVAFAAATWRRSRR